MKDLPIIARVYVAAIVLAGAVVLAFYGPHTIVNPWLFLALLVCSSVASALKVSLPLTSSGSTMSVSYAVDFAALLLLGADATMWVAAMSAWSQCTFRTQARSPIHRTLFSMASLVLTVKATGLVYTWLGGPPPGVSISVFDFSSASELQIAKPLVGAATAYFICNTAFVATAISLSTRQQIFKVWNENFLWSAPSYFVGALASAVAASVIARGGYWMASLAAAPLYLTYRTYKVYLGRIQDQQRHVQQVSDLHLATIEALALAIDAKDQTAQSHIRRVQVYAAGLAQALGMSANEIQGVKTAALLHDIGKLAVPEHILSKPGPLTQEEFQKIRIHPQVGAEIISGVPFPYPVAPLILSHHERWDGKGYPAGLRGDEIPLGARILSVVDYFDALMSERPYHKAMSFEAAIGLLRQESGKALDPRVVQTFIDMYPALQAEAESSQEPARRLTRVPTQAPAAQPAVGLVESASPRTNVFEDIALAHREIYALYEIAQAMGSSLGVADTMALISSKLSNIVPFSCCALYLYNEETEVLRCRFATGTEADLVQPLAIRNGHGLNGWVARNRRPLVNARPSADFEAAGSTVQTTLQSALVCPLVFNERFIGTIAVYHTADAIYTDDHRRLLDRISEQAAAVIYNSMVFEQTQEDSLTDPLTALPNTRFMFMHLTRELARANRLKSEVSLLVMDLDNFKEINDTYGHHVGDRALREVAAVLRTAIRPYDICVRYAGDEFIVVLSGCGGEEAERKRVELQRAVDALQFEARPGKMLALAISVGAAVFPHDGDSYETLLATADSRMYRDKTRRKRRGPHTPDDQNRQTPVTENELRRSATGVL
ncbi:MAG TPA: HD domain-containing phosphohydrolase [Vicinamibacterales bacterium]|jgi:diguanylate cyclase (GGDEF)-like protein/putative nucleotidyltransferase with HDIG domain